MRSRILWKLLRRTVSYLTLRHLLDRAVSFNSSFRITSWDTFSIISSCFRISFTKWSTSWLSFFWRLSPLLWSSVRSAMFAIRRWSWTKTSIVSSSVSGVSSSISWIRRSRSSVSRVSSSWSSSISRTGTWVVSSTMSPSVRPGVRSGSTSSSSSALSFFTVSSLVTLFLASKTSSFSSVLVSISRSTSVSASFIRAIPNPKI